MILVIGARGAGKRKYVSENFCDTKVLWDFHYVVKDEIKNNTDMACFIDNIIKEYKEGIIVCDEIGCGIVPANDLEIRWRDECGRCLVEIAKKADSVIRLCCGIAQKIK